MQQLSFFNTTDLQGKQLQEAIKKATTQEEKIKVLFDNNPRALLSANVVHDRIFKGTNTPLTSTRRAISNLKRKGYLEKTENQMLGDYGAPVYTFRLKQRK